MPSVIEHLTIVPDAHVRIADVPLQWRLYEAFHVHPVSRWGHIVGTAGMLTAGIIGLSALTVGPVDLALPAIVAMSAWYATVDRLAGLIAAVLGLAVWAVVAVLVPPLWIAAALAMGGLAVQTLSHLTEPVPPPWSGSARFVSLSEYLRQPDLGRVLLGLCVMTVSGFVLEAWATTRIFPYQLLFLLNKAGWRKAERARVLRERDRILGDAARGVPPNISARS